MGMQEIKEGLKELNVEELYEVSEAVEIRIQTLEGDNFDDDYEFEDDDDLSEVEDGTEDEEDEDDED